MLWGTPEHVQFISKEILDGLNFTLFPQYLHYHNIFKENLRKVDVWKQRNKVKEQHTDVEEQEGVYLQKANRTLNRN